MHVEARAIVAPHSSVQQMRDRMCAEIGRHIADPQASSGTGTAEECAREAGADRDTYRQADGAIVSNSAGDERQRQRVERDQRVAGWSGSRATCARSSSTIASQSVQSQTRSRA